MYQKILSDKQKELIQRDIDKIIAEAAATNRQAAQTNQSDVYVPLDEVLSDIEDESSKALLKTAIIEYIEGRIQNHITDYVPSELMQRLDVLLEKRAITVEELTTTVMFVYQQITGKSIFAYASKLAVEVVSSFKKLYDEGVDYIEKLTTLDNESQLLFIQHVNAGDFEAAELILAAGVKSSNQTEE